MPNISFCNKRYTSLVSEIAVASVIRKAQEGSRIPDLDVDQNYANAFVDLSNLLMSLYKLQVALDTRTSMLEKSNATDVNKTEQKLLKEWATVKEDLGKR